MYVLEYVQCKNEQEYESGEDGDSGDDGSRQRRRDAVVTTNQLTVELTDVHALPPTFHQPPRHTMTCFFFFCSNAMDGGVVVRW